MKDIKQIEEKARQYSTNSVGKSNEFTKAWHKVYGGVMYGVKLATQWNSPDDKPEEFYDLFISYNRDLWLGYYKQGEEVVFLIMNLTNREFVRGKLFLKDIDGWQYLPEAIRKSNQRNTK